MWNFAHVGILKVVDFGAFQISDIRTRVVQPVLERDHGCFPSESTLVVQLKQLSPLSLQCPYSMHSY